MSSASEPSHRVLRRGANEPIPSETEAEARLRTEGYESFRWYDVPGAQYPKHRHAADECIWVLSGKITFEFETGSTVVLEPGDRLYVPARSEHTAHVPPSAGVTYLVGQKASTR